ncbi:hypothetical protein KKC32_05030 [Patescibacteria group bacterium]|nr:hypothetical protein [Patescibacteria group bacterium]
MTQKCLKCRAPISGFLGKIARLAGVKPSETKPGYCNKCENEAPEVSAQPQNPQALESSGAIESIAKPAPLDLFEEEQKKTE